MITFTANTKIKSADVNQNFSDLASGVGDTNSNSLNIARRSIAANMVVSGLTMATSATLSTTLVPGVALVNGKYVSINSTIISVAASKDTYADLKDDGTVVLVPVANGATTGMTLTTNSDGSSALRLGRLVSSASAITSVTQNGPDPLGNTMYNLSPTRMKKEEAWTAAPFSNGWVDYAAGYDSTAYMKDSLGFVHIKGLVKNGTANSTVLTLPVGYRPANQLIFNALSDSATVARVDAFPDGTIRQTAGGQQFLSLNAIIFKAEQ